jgi:hypothetical protein
VDFDLKMKKNIGLQLIYLCVAAVAVTFIIQYAFDRALDAKVLTYIIPACIVSYVSGRQDERKSSYPIEPKPSSQERKN